MAFPRRLTVLRALLAIGVCLFITRTVAPILAQRVTDLAVVVHPAVGVDNLSLGELRRYLLGDRDHWPSGVRVTRLIRAPRSNERDEFMKICDMTETEYRRHWISLRNQADIGKEPMIVASSEVALDQVSHTPGAITFIETPVTAKGVKILKIDGKQPGQPGYAVK